MSKQEFLSALRKKLSGLPGDDIEERLNFYNEMIDDRVEEGLTEEQAVEELGSIDDIVSQIMSEIPLAKLVKEKVKPNRSLRAWEIVLLILGSPLWLSLLAAALLVVIAIYTVIWSVVVMVWAAGLSVAACSIGGFVSAAVLAVQGNVAAGFTMFGVGIAGVGATILMAYCCAGVVKWVFSLSGKIFIGIKSFFIKKEAAR